MSSLEKSLLDGEKSALRSLVDAEAQTLAIRISGLHTREEKLNAIVVETDPIRFFDDRSGYFFTYELDGTRINVPIDKSNNGKNVISSQDKRGNYFVRSLIDAARSGGGFAEYYFEKPGKGIQPKLAYAKIIPGTDIVIGTGVYIDSVAAEQARVYQVVAESLAKLMYLIAGMFGVILLLTFGLARLLSHSVSAQVSRTVGQLLGASEQVSAASEQLSAQSMNLAEGASEQVATLQLTAESLKRISSVTQKNNADAAQADQFARQALQAASRGEQDMEKTVQAIRSIDAASTNVSKIVKTIDEISFQTNILSLNAAIEAARSGQHGLGFAVVADEVRKLAQRSAAAAQETTDNIEGAIARSVAGVALTQKVSESLCEIVSRVHDVAKIAEAVAAGAHEQASAIRQFDASLDQIHEVTQRNAANAEQSAAAAQELNSQTASVRAALAELTQFVTGRAVCS